MRKNLIITIVFAMLGAVFAEINVVETSNIPESFKQPQVVAAPVQPVQMLELEELDLKEEKWIEPVNKATPTKKQLAAIDCLAKNIYFEARNQGHKARVAIGRVVMNRVEHRRFPETVCGVIRQGPHRPSWKDNTILIPVKNRCQFSWYCDGRTDNPENYIYSSSGKPIESEKEAWEDSYKIAYDIIMHNRYDGFAHGAINYHAHYVSPNWSNLHKVAIIEDHIFYAED